MIKYLKIACILGILGLGCNVIADDVQKKIEALSKENELLELKLELKKKNEQLKIKLGKIDKSGFLGFCKGEYKNTGCFIGVELAYAPSVTNEISIYDGEALTTFDRNTYAFPINLALGWQWYFTHKMRDFSLKDIWDMQVTIHMM